MLNYLYQSVQFLLAIYEKFKFLFLIFYISNKVYCVRKVIEMSSEHRKVGFYSVDFKNYRQKNNDRTTFDQEVLLDIINYITSLPIVDRLLNLEKERKTYFLYEYIMKNNKLLITFKSCKFGHFPPYLNSVDGTERATSKNEYEGETEKTHLVIRLDLNEAYLVLEERRNGVGISKIVKYFNEFSRRYYESKQEKRKYIVQYTSVAGKEFLMALKEAGEIKGVEIFTYKKNIGDAFLDLSLEEDCFIKDEVIVKLKSVPKEGVMKRTCNRLYNSIKSEGSNITRIRIHTAQDDFRGPIDSDFFRKTENIEVELEKNGTVKSSSIFNKLIRLIE